MGVNIHLLSLNDLSVSNYNNENKKIKYIGFTMVLKKSLNVLLLFFQTILDRKERFAPSLLKGLNSVNPAEVRWSRRLMKISDKMKFDLATQDAIFEIGFRYITNKSKFRSELPHLPDILQMELATLRKERDSQLRKVLTVQYETFKEYYYKYNKY